VNTEEITAQIMGAWDEIQDAEAVVDNDDTQASVTEEEGDQPEPEQEDTEGGEDESEEGEAPAPGGAEGDEEASEEEQESDAEEDEHVTASFQSDDPEVQAFLAKFQGDPERALKGALQVQRSLTREGQRRVALEKEVEQLRGELANTHALTGLDGFLTEEQREWVGESMESGRPGVYVLNAIRAGEFGLARAVCQHWAEVAPLEAMRAAQQVDAAEYQTAMTQQGEPEPLNTGKLMEVLVEYYPEMPQYEIQMVKTLEALGPEHPLVQDARSQNAEIAARGILAVYEIARSQTATVASAREQVKNGRRQAANEAKREAVVTSSQQAPNPGQTPKPRALGPGLTLEELDAAWNE